MMDDGDGDDGDDGDDDQYLPVGPAQSRHLSSGWETSSDPPPTKHHFQLKYLAFFAIFPILLFFFEIKVTLYLLSKSSIWWNSRCCSKKNWP